MQEYSIENTYKKLKHFRIKSLGVLAVVMSLLTAVMSIFYGNPFPHKVTVAFFTFTEAGWITEKSPIWMLVCLLSLIIVRTWQKKFVQKAIKPYMELLTDECDALRFREITYRGVTHGKENGKLSDKYTLFCFEWMYTLALNAREEHKEVLEYLEQSWYSRKTKRLYGTLVKQGKMNVCCIDGDLVSYMEIFKTLPKRLKKDPFCTAQMHWVQGNYESMLEVLQTVKTQNNLQKVKLAFAKGRCFARMKRYEEAIEQFDYVIEYGNTLGCRQFAVDMKEGCEKSEG